MKVRLAALQSLQAASFSVVAIRSRAAATTLRPCARSRKIRIRSSVSACSACWRARRTASRRRNSRRLKNPEKALVPPEKALQLLSYDVHAEAYPLARAIVSKPPNADCQAGGLAAARGGCHRRADVREDPARQRRIARDPANLGRGAASAQAREDCRRTRARSCSTRRNRPRFRRTSLTALTQFGDDDAGR